MKAPLLSLTLLFVYNSIVEGKSLNGRKVAIEEAPWTVVVEKNGKPEIFGAIVGPNLVASITRPINDISPTILVARAGSAQARRGGSTHKITKVVTHPWAQRSDGYDVGVFTVDPPFQLDETRQIIKLNRSAPREAEAKAYYFNDEGDLTEIALTLLDWDWCNNWYRILGGLDESQACAKSIAEGGPCEDLGVAVVQHGKVVGVVGHYPICNELDYWPLLYTNFTEPYVSMWLEANVPDV